MKSFDLSCASFGMIDFDVNAEAYWSESWNKRALLNVGDFSEYLVVEQLLKSLGVNIDRVKRLSISELISYRGNTIIVPINISLDSYVGYNTILEKLSPDIIPVFLGMSFANQSLNSSQIATLKKHEPIGCRDERSFLLLKSLSVECYLNGCTASVLHTRHKKNDYSGKILFVDVPIDVLKYIPNEIKGDIVFLNQECYFKKDELSIKPSDWGLKILDAYAGVPKMIVTSRFHGAVLGLANNIPTIITLNKYTYRFSWLLNYYPLYTQETYSDIDWLSPKKPHFSKTKELIFEVAKKRIQQVVFQNYHIPKLTELQKRRIEIDESNSSNQSLYFSRVWEQMILSLKKNDYFEYGFWGINDNSIALYNLIKEHFPHAKYTALFDMYKKYEFEGICSVSPRELSKYRDNVHFYVIVSSFVASKTAADLFQQYGFPSKRSFLCELEYIQKKDISEGKK